MQTLDRNMSGCIQLSLLDDCSFVLVKETEIHYKNYVDVSADLPSVVILLLFELYLTHSFALQFIWQHMCSCQKLHCTDLLFF